MKLAETRCRLAVNDTWNACSQIDVNSRELLSRKGGIVLTEASSALCQTDRKGDPVKLTRLLFSKRLFADDSHRLRAWHTEIQALPTRKVSPCPAPSKSS